MSSKHLMIGFCGTWLVACGGGGDLSFQDVCDRGAAKICEKISVCVAPVAKADCIAQIKAQNCSGGVEQFCSSGSYQPSKASACLDALDAAGCEVLEEQPAACMPEVMCSSAPVGSKPSTNSEGEACHPIGDPKACDAKASVCYAAGSSSSCPDKGLCVGDAQGMTCAAHCTADADCASAGAGLVCTQDCGTTILNGFCVSPGLKKTFLQTSCNSGNAGGLTGWSL